MNNTNITRNYHAHGGSEWVIGGKLTFLPGATVEGAEGLFDLPSAAQPRFPYIADSEATYRCGSEGQLQRPARRPARSRPDGLRPGRR